MNEGQSSGGTRQSRKGKMSRDEHRQEVTVVGEVQEGEADLAAADGEGGLGRRKGKERCLGCR